ncbi:MAG: VOC family protein [Bacteroidetes bacterium]|nr:VOC family protein [Bacteroidota bacterium]
MMKIDHIELFVPDRYEAAEWYSKVLEFQIIKDFSGWADEGGPLMISNDGGSTKIALFEGEPQRKDDVQGFIRLAFSVDAVEFIEFINSSGNWRDTPLTQEEIKDHHKAISVYFSDPYGNLLEITTYDYDAAKKML